MKCVYCSAKKTTIPNSRSTKLQTQTWRRHYCTQCKRTFTTFEKPDMKHLAIDTDGALNPYSRGKLYLSIARSFQTKQPDYKLLDTIVDTIEIKLLKLSTPTLTNHIVAEITLTTLKPLNKRAYLHYLADHTN